MQELIDQIIELIQNKPIGTREKSEWIERLPDLNEEQLNDLLAVLQAQDKEEMDQLQQKNLEKLEASVQELERLTQKGIQIIYQKGEELNKQTEEAEQEAVLGELQAI